LIFLRHQATAALNKDFYRDAKCIPALFDIVASAPEQNVRLAFPLYMARIKRRSDGSLS
jgi:hypothetical protein